MGGVVLASCDVDTAVAVAERAGGHLVLLDNAASAARSTHPAASALGGLAAGGTVVVVHDEAALRRGLGPAELAEGIKTVDSDEIADLVADARGPVVWL